MKKKTTKAIKDPKVGDKIYVGSCMYISHGSDDFAGGEATVSSVEEGQSGGETVTYVEIAERPGHAYNWTQFLAEKQAQLKKDYKGKKAHPDPDIDTPWAEPGDIVDGKVYNGPPIW